MTSNRGKHSKISYYKIFSIVLVIIISLGILGKTYISLTFNYSYLKFLYSSPQEVVIENHYFYSLEEINDFKINHSFHFLYFPIGRPILNKSTIRTYLNSQEVDLPIISDGVGGSWVNVSFEMFNEDITIILRFILKKSSLRGFKDPHHSNTINWTEPSLNIDSDSASLIEIAQNITTRDDTVIDKARSIFDFVKDLLEFKYPSYAPEVASHILFSEYGQCIQYSNLFVGFPSYKKT